jgi:hypothetical protein
MSTHLPSALTFALSHSRVPSPIPDKIILYRCMSASHTNICPAKYTTAQSTCSTRHSARALFEPLQQRHCLLRHAPQQMEPQWFVPQRCSQPPPSRGWHSGTVGHRPVCHRSCSFRASVRDRHFHTSSLAAARVVAETAAVASLPASVWLLDTTTTAAAAAEPTSLDQSGIQNSIIPNNVSCTCSVRPRV